MNVFKALALATLVFADLPELGYGAEIDGLRADDRRLDQFGYPTNHLLALDRGRADAERDVSNGLFRLPAYGFPSPWASDYYRILKGRYNVHPYTLGGCDVSAGLEAYAKGYSEVSCPAIQGRFGTNIFNTIWREAQNIYKKRSDLELPVFARALTTHLVKIGESLISIAKQYCVPLQSLVDANPGIVANQLQMNQVLLVPHPSDAY